MYCVSQVASGVAALGLSPKATFGMYTANTPAFQIATIGCFAMGLTCVPIYDTLGDNIVQCANAAQNLLSDYLRYGISLIKLSACLACTPPSSHQV